MGRLLPAVLLLFLPRLGAAATGWGQASPTAVDTRLPVVELISPSAGDTLRAGNPAALHWRVIEDSLDCEDPPLIAPIIVRLFDGEELFAEWMPAPEPSAVDYALEFAELWALMTLDARWSVTVVDYFGNTATASSGSFAVFGSGDAVANVPAASAPNLQSFPNPFNPVTTLRLYLPSALSARLSIHDVAGREIAQLHAGPLAAGWHSWRWDARGHSSGLYAARLSYPGGIRSAKLLLLK
jgi:hypothetical protein